MTTEARIQTPNIREGSGVATQIPPAPNGRPKGLVPSTWMNRTIEVTLSNDECIAGRMLDCCGAGIIMSYRRSKRDVVRRRLVFWDQCKYLDLVAD